MTIWRMFTHHIDPENALAWTRQNGRIAIGWGRVGDVERYQSQEEIKAAIRAQYPIPPFRNNAHLGAPSLWDFCRTMQREDLVILNGKKPRALVVKIVGDYRYEAGESPLEGDCQNQRRIEMTSLDGNALWFAAGRAPGSHRYKTLIRCAHPLHKSDLAALR